MKSAGPETTLTGPGVAYTRAMSLHPPQPVWHSGWRLLGVISAALFVIFATVLFVAGANEDGIRLLIRVTARTSVVLFCTAWATSSLARLFPGHSTRWLARNRRYVGLGFAVSHVVHYAAVYAVAQIDPKQFFAEEGRSTTDPITIMTVAFLAILVALSFDRSQTLVGGRVWRGIHWLLCGAFWVFFAVSYGGRVAEGQLFYVPFAALLVATLGLRIAAFVSRRSTQRSAAPA